MNTIITLTSQQAATMADTLKLIKAESAILTLNCICNGNYVENNVVYANEGEQIQAVIWSTNKGEAEKKVLVIDIKITETLDILKALGSDIEIREDNGAYYFYVEGSVPSVPIKVLTEKPEINTPDQSTLIASYNVSGKELSTKLGEIDRSSENAASEFSKALTMRLSEKLITLTTADGATAGIATLVPKEGVVKEEKAVAIPSKYLSAVKKVAAMGENVKIAVFGSAIVIGTSTLVYMAGLSVSVIPDGAANRISSWAEAKTEAVFTVDSEKLQGLINVLRIGTTKLAKPILVFTNEKEQVQMEGFDGTSVVLQCSKIEGKVKKVGLNSNLLEKCVKQLKRGNITISVADDVNIPVRLQNGTIDEPVKDSVLFLLKINLDEAKKVAKAEAEAGEEAESEE